MRRTLAAGAPVSARPWCGRLHRPSSSAADTVTIASWNTALGAADIPGFVRTLPDPGAPIVLLLQEVVRGGRKCRAVLPPGTGFGRRHGGASIGPRFEEIEAIAGGLGFGVYYVPSMRNGAPSASDEDRGNAILSNLPLTDLMAIELPFERQRRVAIARDDRRAYDGRSAVADARRSARTSTISAAPNACTSGSAVSAARGRRAALVDARSPAPSRRSSPATSTPGSGSPTARTSNCRARSRRRSMVDPRRTFHGMLRLDHVFYRLRVRVARGVPARRRSGSAPTTIRWWEPSVSADIIFPIHVYFRRVHVSARTTSSASLARAAWARCIARTIRGSAATSR